MKQRFTWTMTANRDQDGEWTFYAVELGLIILRTWEVDRFSVLKTRRAATICDIVTGQQEP